MATKGLDELSKTLSEAGKAFQALDGTIANLKFDPQDASAVENAISETERAIDRKIAPYRGNALIEEAASDLKSQCRVEILERANIASLEQGETKMSKDTDYDKLFRQINNTVSDLQRASNDRIFQDGIERLSGLLEEDIVADINNSLTRGIDLQAWINKSNSTRGGMVGSGRAKLPKDHKERLGIQMLLIHFLAETNESINFSYNFYYQSNNISGNLQNMASQLIIPFARDYIDYVKEQIPSYNAPNQIQSHAVQTISNDTYNLNVTGGAQQQFNIGNSSGIQNNEAVQNDLQDIQNLITAIKDSNLAENEKEALAVPLEMVIEQINSENPNPSFVRNAYQQIKQKVLEKGYDKFADVATNPLPLIERAMGAMNIMG